ncbi:MAG: hypothetical protein H6741_00685 [Alphaproteobacteria bacterium]|nr:hypothetical protein [Alphaproteobacteria bacterium]
MDPQKLPIAVLLALGLSACGEKEVDSGPCLSAWDSDSGDDTAGPCLTPSDDTSSEEAAAPAPAPETPEAKEREGVLSELLQRGALPEDVAAELDAQER